MSYYTINLPVFQSQSRIWRRKRRRNAQIDIKRKEKTTCKSKWFFGRGSKNRTHDTRFWRPLLYQLSYAPIQKRDPQVSLFLVGL